MEAEEVVNTNTNSNSRSDNNSGTNNTDNNNNSGVRGQACVKSDAENNKDPNPGKYFANKYQLLALCVMGSLGNVQGYWNVMSGSSGLGAEIICSIVFGVAIVLYYFCVSELSSTFPFAGGSYALARCTLGFFPGYLVGCLEAFSYVVFLGIYNIVVADILGVIFPGLGWFVYVIFLLTFVVEFGLCSSQRLFWWSVSAMALCTFVINVAYVFGALRYIHFQQWAYSTSAYPSDDLPVDARDDDSVSSAYALSTSTEGSLFVGSGMRLFRSIPFSLGIYIGPEFVNFACDDVQHPRKQVPFAQIVGAFVMLVFNVVVPILACSMAPGTMGMSGKLNPLIPSMVQIFGISHRNAYWLELPGTFGYCVCVCYTLSKLISSMAESRIFPLYFSVRRKKTNVPMRAMILGLVLGVVVIIIPAVIDFTWLGQWANMLSITVSIVNSSQLIGFAILRIKLLKFVRDFVSPFGLSGMFLPQAAFALSCLSSVAFRRNGPISDCFVGIYLIIVSVVYYCGGRYYQQFSAEEKELMLPVHAEILTANGKCIFSPSNLSFFNFSCGFIKIC
jgi:ethanolamine permease